LGESTAESGPRCGEAEEAKRRPAMSLGPERVGAEQRLRALTHAVPGPFPIDP